jgi:hypothetical protein
LTTEDVVQIKHDLSAGVHLIEVCHRYKINDATGRRIISGLCWQDALGPLPKNNTSWRSRWEQPLTATDIDSIRKRYRYGSLVQLSREFKVTAALLFFLATGERTRHLREPLWLKAIAAKGAGE